MFRSDRYWSVCALVVCLVSLSGCAPALQREVFGPEPWGTRKAYEYSLGPLDSDGVPVAIDVRMIVIEDFLIVGDDYEDVMLRFVQLDGSEYWRMPWLRKKVAMPTRRLQLPGEDEAQGDTYTNWLVSLEPLLVVTTRGSTFPRVDGPLRWVSDGVWIRSKTMDETFEQRFANDRLLLKSGLIASHVLDEERPIRWYSPTRRIKPRMIEDDGGEVIELDTGKERFVIERIEGRWVVERMMEGAVDIN